MQRRAPRGVTRPERGILATMSIRPPRIGLLFRGDRSAPPLVGRAKVLSDAFAAFDDLGVDAEPVVYSDDAVDEVRDQLLGLDGVLVWVNPIQDGANRAALDELLRDVAGKRPVRVGPSRRDHEDGHQRGSVSNEGVRVGN